MIPIEPWIQFGSFGLLAFVIFFGLKTAIPALTKSNEAVAEALHEQRIALARLTVVILQHDATVRGQNPEVLGTSEEILERILKIE